MKARRREAMVHISNRFHKMSKDLRDIFENLTGKWTLNRVIYHLDINVSETALGTASFSKIDFDKSNSLHYEETGILLLQQGIRKINFNRKYIYQLNAESIDIILDDGVTKGQLFQTLTPQENGKDLKGTEHSCRLDKHNGKHFFENEFSFHTEYTITGPAGLKTLPNNYRVTANDLKGALQKQKVTLQKGDVVLLRTGQMVHYANASEFLHEYAGISLDAVKWLIEEQGIMLLGADN